MCQLVVFFDNVTNPISRNGHPPGVENQEGLVVVLIAMIKIELDCLDGLLPKNNIPLLVSFSSQGDYATREEARNGKMSHGIPSAKECLSGWPAPEGAKFAKILSRKKRGKLDLPRYGGQTVKRLSPAAGFSHTRPALHSRGLSAAFASCRTSRCIR